MQSVEFFHNFTYPDFNSSGNDVMLKDNFYFVTEKHVSEDDLTEEGIRRYRILWTLKLNPGHAVYVGHFPGNPVVPGACQVQLIKELVSDFISGDLILEKSDNIKFMGMIDPAIVQLLTVDVDIWQKDNTRFEVSANILSGDKIFMKFKGRFRQDSENHKMTK